MNDQAARLRSIAAGREHDRGKSGTSRRETRSGCLSIAVTSGKGGVGKTNIALFLAVALSRLGKRVLVLDADLGLANLHILLGIAPKHNLSHVVEGACGIDQIVSPGPGGISIAPGATGIESMANLDTARSEHLCRQLELLENGFDIMVIDTGAGISAGVMHFASHADVSLLVMTPEPTSLADAYATIKVLFDRGAEKIGVMVNMASEHDGTETFDKLDALVVKFLKRPIGLFGILPFDRDIGRAVRRQKVATLEQPNGVTSLKMNSLARRMVGMPRIEKRSIFARMLKPFAARHDDERRFDVLKRTGERDGVV